MTPSHLEFNFAVREWSNESFFTIIPSGTDEKIIVKYADLLKNQLMSEEQHEELRREISQRIKGIACIHDTDVDLEFADLGFGELGVIIYIKEAPGREDAKEEYYDLLYLGARRSNEQHARLRTLIKKYGFK